jgi:mannose-6-phosphate isomerase-like protein (cupin superfamily)
MKGTFVEITDTGPEHSVFDLETATTTNQNYRTVAWSGTYLQVTLMSIPVGESVGLETHPDTDQFLRLDAGKGRVVMGPTREDLPFSRDVEDGWAIMVPAGTWHDVINTGDEPMRLYAIYAPVHHAAGKVQATAAQADADEQAGTDEPPEWSVQPAIPQPDQHANAGD